MSGAEIYTDLISKRDFTDSIADNYAQFIETLAVHVGSDLFPLLEKANKENKTLSVKDVTLDEYTLNDIILL